MAQRALLFQPCSALPSTRLPTRCPHPRPPTLRAPCRCSRCTATPQTQTWSSLQATTTPREWWTCAASRAQVRAGWLLAACSGGAWRLGARCRPPPPLLLTDSSHSSGRYMGTFHKLRCVTLSLPRLSPALPRHRCGPQGQGQGACGGGARRGRHPGGAAALQGHQLGPVQPSVGCATRCWSAASQRCCCRCCCWPFRTVHA